VRRDVCKTTAKDGEGAAVTCDGKLFHRRAAATGNALSPFADSGQPSASNIQRHWWGVT